MNIPFDVSYHFDQAKYKEAQYYFNLALKLRQKKGDRSLINSTQLALDMVQQSMCN